MKDVDAIQEKVIDLQLQLQELDNQRSVVREKIKLELNRLLKIKRLRKENNALDVID